MSAIFAGPDDCYRLRLDRRVDNLLGGSVAVLIGVNPSTAGAEANDQTIRKDIGFARIHGWRRFIKVNLFAHVATDVHELRYVDDPIGPENDRYIEEAMREADVIVPCWGPAAKVPKQMRGRWREVVAIAGRVGKPMMCLGTAKDGQPRHTLMLSYSTRLVPWTAPAARLTASTQEPKMTKRDELIALAERCEAAEGSNYDLECDIWDAIYPGERDARFATLIAGGPYKGRLGPADRDGYVQPLRAYTASLDAALALVPEDHAVDLTMWGPLWGGKHRARVIPIYQDGGDRWLHRGSDPDFCVNAATPALALCAASLRALANQEPVK